MKYEIDLDRARDTGIYYVYWRGVVKGKLRSGRNSLFTKAKDEAEAAFATFLATKGVKAETAAKNGVVYKIADLWPFYMVKLTKGRTGPRAASVWEHCLEPHFGQLTVPEATNEFTVQEYVEKRLAGKLSCPGVGGSKKGKPVTEATVRNELVLLLACLNFCSHRDYNKRLFDPTLIGSFTMPEESKPRERALSEDEMDRLLAAASARSQAEGKLSRIEIFIRLAYQTAGREFAIRTLTFDPKRVNFERNYIDLNDGHRLKKKDKKRAIVYMDETLAAMLRRALAESNHAVPLEQRYVLGHAGQIWPTFMRVVHEAGLTPEGWVLPPRGKTPLATGISAHTLRHTAATNMVVAGVPLAKVAKFLGNTIAMVEKVYAHLQPEHLKDAAAVLAPKLRIVRNAA